MPTGTDKAGFAISSGFVRRSLTYPLHPYRLHWKLAQAGRELPDLRTGYQLLKFALPHFRRHFGLRSKPSHIRLGGL